MDRRYGVWSIPIVTGLADAPLALGQGLYILFSCLVRVSLFIFSPVLEQNRVQFLVL